MTIASRKTELFIGDEEAERFFGTAGTDVIFARGGDDVVRARAGDDIVLAGDGADDVGGGLGADWIDGGAGDDLLRGGGGDDVMLGGDGADTVHGGGGDDLVRGGLGADFVSGGLGADRFAYATGEGGDVVADYAIGRDSFLLDAASFGVTDTLAFRSVARDGAGTDAGLLDVEGGGNVYVLQGGFENAGAAAGALAAALGATPEDEGAGFFVYFNVNLGVSRLFHTTDLDGAGALQQLANLGDVGSGDQADQTRFAAADFAFGDLLA